MQYLLENKRRKKKEAKRSQYLLGVHKEVDQGGSVRGRVYTTSSVVYNTVTQETGTSYLLVVTGGGGGGGFFI